MRDGRLADPCLICLFIYLLWWNSFVSVGRLNCYRIPYKHVAGRSTLSGLFKSVLILWTKWSNWIAFRYWPLLSVTDFRTTYVINYGYACFVFSRPWAQIYILAMLIAFIRFAPNLRGKQTSVWCLKSRDNRCHPIVVRFTSHQISHHSTVHILSYWEQL